MAEEINTSPQTGATPATGQPATGTPASTGATPTKPAVTSLEEAMARIAELERHSANKEEQATRQGKTLSAAEKELAAYKEKERIAQEAQLSEAEKAKQREAEKDQLIQQYKQQLITSQVKIAAQTKGIIDPDIAALAIADKLTYGKDGMPENVDEALTELLKSKPYLAPKPAEQQPPSPAETAQQRTPPNTPAMNPPRPGLSAIPSPNQAPQGTKFVDPGWGAAFQSGPKRQ